MRHVNAEILRLFFGVGSPDFPQQLFVRDDLPRVPCQHLEKTILGGSQFYLESFDGDGMAVEVDGEMPGFKMRIFRAERRPSLDRPKPGQELGRIKRLG